MEGSIVNADAIASLERPEMSRGVVNDFSITFSTINGSGSATANLTIMRAIFKMGIPVSGKNIFPSNIKGLPTWFTIRLSKDGFLGYTEKSEIVVVMNPQTFARDLATVKPGGVIFYTDEYKGPIERQDVVAYPMPVKKLAKETDIPANLRDYIENVVYIGILAQMLGVDFDKIYQAFETHFQGKKKAVESNFEVVQRAAKWAEENLEKRDPYRVEPMNLTDGMILGSGNAAAALGSIFGGIQFSAWYPITPSSSIPESLNEYLPMFRKAADGKATYAIVQAEDEISAVGMTIGAGWAGLRAMTATSGPGLSLMAEYLGLAYYAEVPLVVWNVQRVGPSTGLPTRTAQGDVTFSYFISHGDTKYIILIPSTLKECFEFGWQSLDIAERFQTPVLVLSDLDLGMNYWISAPFEYPDRPMDRGKILWEEDLDKMIERCQGKWGRYLDVDGDGIPYRTVMGNRHPRGGYFARGTGHDDFGKYTELPEDWEKGLKRLALKFETARAVLPKPVIETVGGAEIGMVAYGTTDDAVEEARYLLRKEGILTDYLRIRALPFSKEVYQFVEQHQRVYVVELNFDGQMRQVLSAEMPMMAHKLRSVAKVDGMPFSAEGIVEMLLSQEERP